MSFIEILFSALVIFLPAGLANMAPVFASRMNFLKPFDKPIDGGHTFRGKRVLGANKTWRGIVAGFVFALLGIAIQRWIDRTACFSCQGYTVPLATANPLLLALLFDLGALGGDSLASFFKRQLNKPPGSAWFPFDQLDFVVGGILLTWPLLQYSAKIVLVILATFFVAHIISTVVGYALGLKDKPI